jgi:hypothetical protein
MTVFAVSRASGPPDGPLECRRHARGEERLTNLGEPQEAVARLQVVVVPRGGVHYRPFQLKLAERVGVEQSPNLRLDLFQSP